MSFLLMIFLTVICLHERFPEPFWIRDLGGVIGLTGLVVLIGVGHAFLLSRWTGFHLLREPSRRDLILNRCERWWSVHQILLIGLYCFALFGLGWGAFVHQHWLWNGQSAPGSEILLLLPFLLGYVLSWALFYDADQVAHRVAYHLLESEPFALDSPEAYFSPTTGRWSYVLFQLRQKAIVFTPLVLLIGYRELERLVMVFGPRQREFFGVFSIFLLAAVFLCLPLLFRVVLDVKPLPPGRIREQLTDALRRLGFRCSNFLVWNTRQGMANAMVVGMVPWLRYVIFTDRMLDEFEEDEILAVLGHEVAHMRHHHMPFYLLFFVLSMFSIGLIAEHHFLPALQQWILSLETAWPWVRDIKLAEALGPNGSLSHLPVVLVVLVYIFVVFGYLSRKCERQADLFGCRAVSCSDPICAGHSETTSFPEAGKSICPTGIWTFIRALEKVCRVNGISRSRPGWFQSWQHGSIASRVAFLESILANPRVEVLFQQRLRWLKIALILGLSCLLAVLIEWYGWTW